MKRYLSLRGKVALLIGAGSMFTAGIAAAGFSWVHLDSFWRHTNSEIKALAAVVADQVAPAITLGDKPAAAEILRSLSADGLVEDAVLYDSQNRCFAWYHRLPGGDCGPKRTMGSDVPQTHWF
ncbi:MAG: CHASE sensor domain-containing protein [Ignavibacteriota bacterium]